MKDKDVFTMTWHGIDIEIVSIPNYAEVFRKIYGYMMSHIEVRSVFSQCAQLPITETGYRSIFITEPDLAERGGVKEYVLSLLDEGAKRKDWLIVAEESRQYQLF